MTLIRTGLLGLLLWQLPVPSFAADDKPAGDDRAARDKALKWLVSKQNDNGSWSEGRYPHNTAITAYAMRALMTNGHWPGEGDYKKTVEKGLRFLLASAQPNGYLVGARGGNMYGHALATQTLAELWARTKDKDIEPVLTKAVDLIVKCQSKEGGWRYQPQPIGHDISCTSMNLLALHAAKQAGMKVPDETFKKALAYIKSCVHPNTGLFTYQPRAGVPGFGRAASGLRSLQALGDFDLKDRAKAVAYLQTNFSSRQFFYYGHVYAVHVMKEVGGMEWEQWREKIHKILLKDQSADGSWSNRSLDSSAASIGPVYQTSLAVLILSVPAK